MSERLGILIDIGEDHDFESNSEWGEETNKPYARPSASYMSWYAECEGFIKKHCGLNSAAYRLFATASSLKELSDEGEEYEFLMHRDILIAALRAVPSSILDKENEDVNEPNEPQALNSLFDNFHIVVRQLRRRYNGRATLDVEDEYDVQDLLHCLLKLYYQDIRSEEWTPSYAGGSSRMDFLLKNEKTVIEVKMTRKGLNDKALGKQLIEDKTKYQTHPDCKRLICFTYDPDGRIANPAGLQNDLNSKDDDFEVEIIIKP